MHFRFCALERAVKTSICGSLRARRSSVRSFLRKVLDPWMERHARRRRKLINCFERPPNFPWLSTERSTHLSSGGYRYEAGGRPGRLRQNDRAGRARHLAELAERRVANPKTDEALPMRSASPPELAVVDCDEVWMRTREPGRGPGVHGTAEGWRETKNAVPICATRTVSDDASQP